MNIITGSRTTQVTDPVTLNALDWYRRELTRARRQRAFWCGETLYWLGAFFWFQSTGHLHLNAWVNVVAMAALIAGCLAVQIIIRRREKSHDLYGWKVAP